MHRKESCLALCAAQAAPAGSTSEDFDGDGISNWQEYQMHPELPLFDSADKDGDRILDSVETANAPILSPLIFADAVADHDGDGVMNYEEVLLGLNLAGRSSGRADGLSDAEVLAWGLLAGVPLAPSTNAVRACWEAIDEAWIEQQGGMAFYGHWLNRTLVNNEPAGWTAFEAEFWGPTNPDTAFIQNPPAPIDLDGDDIPDMDRDGDGLPDLWEYRYQLDPRNEDDDSEDPDGDTLINLVEFASGTNPRLADTDGDGFTDAEELAHQSDPRQGSSLPPVVLQLTGKAAHQHYPGETTPPLAVRATQAGIARMGIEVTFTRLTGAGMLSPASQAGASAASPLTVTTGADGLAAITYTAAGEPEKAIIRATAPGVTANIAFTIGVIAVPDDFAGAGSGGGQVGGSGGGEVGGLASILPTASRILEALFAGSDGMFLRHAARLDKDKHFPEDDDLGWLYLGAGQPLDGVSSGGYGTIDLADPTKGVSHQRRIVFESANRPCSRTYLVFFFQDERVNPGLEYLMSLEPKLAIKTGTLTFSAQDQKTRTITIEGSIPPEYMKKAADANGNPAVDFLGSPPAKEGDRFWMALLPVELAPEVLAVNTNFDEGDTTESHAAKPDCANGTLKAKKDHLDGKWQEGDIVTDDLHKGFFGLRPGTLPYTETAGAVVKIKKLDKNDPETNRKQSGHVRLYAVWGSQGSESEMKIDLYDKDSLVANDIGPQLYHQNPNTPVTFYWEGVEPGKITLEFSYQKGSASFKHEQEFLVATKKTRAQWREEVRYQIRLQESSFSPPNQYADITSISPERGFRHGFPPSSVNDNSRYIALMYYYYGQLFDENQEKFLWPGMARVAATSIYAGMSDMYLWNTNFYTGGEPGAVSFVNSFMIPGAQAIFNDLAWAHRAYAASGIYAIKHTAKLDRDTLNVEVWETLDEGIAQNNIAKIRDAGGALLDREQNVVIQPYYAAIGPVKFKPPGVNWLWAFWLGGVEVTRDADGKCEIGEWMSANSVHNPIPGPNPIPAGSDYGPLSFRSVVPGGRLDNAGDRWAWINHAEHGMLPRWSGTGTGAGSYSAAMRLNAVRQVLHDAALVYSQTGGAGLPPW